MTAVTLDMFFDTNQEPVKPVKHKVPRTCFNCIHFSSSGECINKNSPNYGTKVLLPEANGCKKHEKPYGGGEIVSTCKDCLSCSHTTDGNNYPVCSAQHGTYISEFDKPCEMFRDKRIQRTCRTCQSLSDNNMCLCPKSPNYRSKINTDYFVSCELHETNLEHDRKLSVPYRWTRRIQSLEAGCAQCSKLQNGTCPGNKVGHPCKDYHARSSAGDNCMNCKHLGGRLPHQQSGKDMYYCNEHKNTVALDDYCCHKFTEK